jgi:hypothetical protein
MVSATEVYGTIESNLNTCKEELVEASKQPSGDPVEVLNDIIKPLLKAAKRGAEQKEWVSQIEITNIDPTIQIKFWTDQQKQSSPASVMFYSEANGSPNLYLSYSIAGSKAKRTPDPIPLDHYTPSGACLVIKEHIQKVLKI